MSFHIGGSMKKVISFLIIFSVFQIEAASSPSEEFMSLNEQNEKIEEVAKSLRREHWINGYEDVESSEEYVTESWLNDYVRRDHLFEMNLYDDEVEELYECISKNNCELYYVSVSSDYMGGYGVEGNFILLYTQTKKYYKISHVVYAE